MKDVGTQKGDKGHAKRAVINIGDDGGQIPNCYLGRILSDAVLPHSQRQEWAARSYNAMMWTKNTVGGISHRWVERCIDLTPACRRAYLVMMRSCSKMSVDNGKKDKLNIPVLASSSCTSLRALLCSLLCA